MQCYYRVTLIVFPGQHKLELQVVQLAVFRQASARAERQVHRRAQGCDVGHGADTERFVIAGVGAGWTKAEFDMLGIDFNDTCTIFDPNQVKLNNA